MSKELIRLSNCTMAFDGDVVLDNINLYINDQEFLTLLGPSGCGKTTTLRIIGGFQTPTQGDVFFDGVRINDVPPHKRAINTVFQRYALFPHLNVFENIAFGLRIPKVDPETKRKVKLPEQEIHDRVMEMLHVVNLNGFEKRSVSSLSGGQQQRVAIARALVNRPKVLLLDEPLGALDLRLRKDMQNELKRIQQAMGITFIYVTHDQEEAMAISDRIAVMKDGVIQHVGTPRDIYQRPKNVFVATFIGRTNIVNAHVKDGIITFADGYHEHLDALDKAAEQDVRCSIRPEEFIICKDGTDGIHGTVQECTYLGLNTHYTIDTDQGDSVEIVEESSIGEGLKKGEKVLLKVKKEKINVFTKDGGTNLIRSDAYEKQ